MLCMVKWNLLCVLLLTKLKSTDINSAVIAGVCMVYVLPREAVLAVTEYTEQHSTELVTLYPESV